MRPLSFKASGKLTLILNIDILGGEAPGSLKMLGFVQFVETNY